LIVDVNTGRLEWVINGYQTLEGSDGRAAPSAVPVENAIKQLATPAPLKLHDIKFPEAKIGEVVTGVKELFTKPKDAPAPPPQSASAPQPSAPIPIPPRIPQKPSSLIRR
jgi:hypothetical protein